MNTKGLSDVETAIEKSFSAIAEGQPEGLLYASGKADDDSTLVALLELENEEERDLFRRGAPTT
jgi:hypothetical protein